MRKLLPVLILAVLLSLFGCGGGSSSTPAPAAIGVAISPGSAFTIAQGQTRTVTATVSNDSASKGVSWALTGGTCTGAACGTLTNTSTASATYNTPAVVANNLSVTVTATSISDSSKSASVTFTVAPLPSLTVDSLADGTLGTSYSRSVTATGGVPPLTYSISEGALPAGLALNTSTGAITGTPTSIGAFDFTARVADSSTPPLTATKALRITVNPAPLTVTTTSLPNGVASSAYSATLAYSGGVPPVKWTVTSGVLPDGVALNSTTGVISGVPSTAGTFDLTVTVRDSASPSEAASKTLSIVVSPALSITTTTLPDGAKDTGYSATLASTGGTAPVTWSISSGSLPAGLTLHSATGVIDGTPTTPGKVDFTVQATDHSTPAATPQKTLSITIAAAPLVITTSTLPGGTANSLYPATTLHATGGTAPVSWTIDTGALPSGVSLHSDTGVIDGTPTAQGTFNFTVKATDSSVTPQVKTKALSIVVAPALSITTNSLPDGAINTAYTATLASTGGTAPVTWSVSSGNLPPGLILNSNTGVISGTPTAAGKTDFSVKATDNSTPPQTPEVALSINIAAAPFVITTSTLANATIGTAYNASLQANGGTPPITWTLTAGSLPAGLTLHTTGVIDGTPTGSPATSNFTVTGNDSGSPVQTKTKSLSITTVTGGSNNSELNGHYAFVLRGYDSQGGRLITMAGSFNADGAGGITGGVEDINTTSTMNTNLAITGGFYSVGADHRGTITLTTSQGSASFAFALGSISGGVSAGGRIIETDSKALTGSFKKQDTAAFSTASVTGNFAFGMGGVDSRGRFAAAGVITPSASGTLTGTVENNDAGTMTSGSIAGTYSIGDTTNGRGTYNDTTNGSSMALYVVSASEVILIGTTPFSTGAPIFTGSAQKQSGTFAVTSMNGNVVFMAQSVASYSGGEPASAYTGIGVFTFNGAGVISGGTIDENDGGTLTQSSGTGTYTVAANGRMTITINGMGTLQEVFYLVGPGKAFSIGTNGAVSEGLLKPQAAGTFNNASLNGRFIFGTEAPVMKTSSVDVGAVTLDGAGHLTGTSDNNDGGTVSLNDSFTDTYTVASNGRVVTSDSIFYIIAPSKAVMMKAEPGKTNPKITMIEQ